MMEVLVVVYYNRTLCPNTKPVFGRVMGEILKRGRRRPQKGLGGGAPLYRSTVSFGGYSFSLKGLLLCLIQHNDF